MNVFEAGLKGHLRHRRAVAIAAGAMLCGGIFLIYKTTSLFRTSVSKVCLRTFFGCNVARRLKMRTNFEEDFSYVFSLTRGRIYQYPVSCHSLPLTP